MGAILTTSTYHLVKKSTVSTSCSTLDVSCAKQYNTTRGKSLFVKFVRSNTGDLERSYFILFFLLSENKFCCS
ncbi:MAG: hypothetical protein ACKO96_34680, partial [Flammeovirgaceae bacterium]